MAGNLSKAFFVEYHQDHPKSNNPLKEASQMLILKVIRVITFRSFGIVKDPFWLVFFNYLELTVFKTIVNVGKFCFIIYCFEVITTYNLM